MPRFVLIGLALALGIDLVYLIFVRELPRSPEQGLSMPQQTLDMSAVVMKQQRGDTVEWMVSSDYATYNETLHQAQLTPVRFQVLNSGGKNPHPRPATFRCDRMPRCCWGTRRSIPSIPTS